MDPDHDYRLDIDLAEYIKQFDLGREKNWHKAMNALGINNDLQPSIMDPKFDDIRRTQPVQNWVQEFVLSNILTLERLPDMLRRKIDQLQGKMAMPALIDDEDKRRLQESYEIRAYGFDALYCPTTAEGFDDVLDYNDEALRLDALLQQTSTTSTKGRCIHSPFLLLLQSEPQNATEATSNIQQTLSYSASQRHSDSRVLPAGHGS